MTPPEETGAVPTNVVEILTLIEGTEPELVMIVTFAERGGKPEEAAELNISPSIVVEGLELALVMLGCGGVVLFCDFGGITPEEPILIVTAVADVMVKAPVPTGREVLKPNAGTVAGVVPVLFVDGGGEPPDPLMIEVITVVLATVYTAVPKGIDAVPFVLRLGV